MEIRHILTEINYFRLFSVQICTVAFYSHTPKQDKNEPFPYNNLTVYRYQFQCLTLPDSLVPAAHTLRISLEAIGRKKIRDLQNNIEHICNSAHGDKFAMSQIILF